MHNLYACHIGTLYLLLRDHKVFLSIRHRVPAWMGDGRWFVSKCNPTGSSQPLSHTPKIAIQRCGRIISAENFQARGEIDVVKFKF